MRYHKLKAGECPGTYVVTEPVTEQDLLRIANQIARKRLAKGTAITSTTDAAERLQTLLQDREHEVFGVLFLDSQHRVLAFEELFRGTLDSASIYPREVVKRALLLNSGAIIAVHNHPSGDPEPSQSDRVFTQALKEALPCTCRKGETPMLEFNDSFTQVAVAQAMSAHGDLHRLITYQLTFPKWAHDYDETGKRTGPDKIKPVPTMHKTSLFVSPLDMVDNLPREINFAWWERECNDLGYPVGEWRRTIVGAYVNHGSNDKPDWSSHT